MAAPTFISENEATEWFLTGSTSTKSISVQTGDIIVAWAADEQAAGTLKIAIEGGGLTWTERKVGKGAGTSYNVMWTATATSTTTVEVKFTVSGAGEFGGIGHWGYNIFVWRGSAGVGAVEMVEKGSGGPLVSITTTAKNSALVMGNADFKAKEGARTYRTASAGTFTEQTFATGTSQYTVDGGYYANAGTAGVKEVGLTAPGEETYTTIVVEILGEPEQELVPKSDIEVTGWA